MGLVYKLLELRAAFHLAGSVRVSQTSPTWVTFGALVAALVLIVDIVFLATGGIDLKVGALIAGLAIARLI